MTLPEKDLENPFDNNLEMTVLIIYLIIINTVQERVCQKGPNRIHPETSVSLF
jgi:hypothetical protein